VYSQVLEIRMRRFSNQTERQNQARVPCLQLMLQKMAKSLPSKGLADHIIRPSYNLPDIRQQSDHNKREIERTGQKSQPETGQN